MDTFASNFKLFTYTPFFKKTILCIIISFFVKSFRSELSTAMKKLNENFTDHEIEMLIAEADLDLDERVNFKEFKTIMAKM